MTIPQALPDYYAVLQVHPDADDEVIAAAYRQLMKKYHPDLAGADRVRVAAHAARAKAINEAFGVLRDAERRRQYDSARILFGTPRPVPEPPPVSRPSTPPAPAEATVDAPRPIGWLAALYYLLPGAYEWEDGQSKEFITVVTLVGVIILGYALVTNRLAPWIGTSVQARLIMTGLLGLMSLPLVWSLPGVMMAVGPTALIVTGIAGPILAQGHFPSWVAWPIAALISLMLSARLYVFGVVPALVACWAINTFT